MSYKKSDLVFLALSVGVLFLSLFYLIFVPENINTMDFIQSTFIKFDTRGWFYVYINQFGYDDGIPGGFIGDSISIYFFGGYSGYIISVFYIILGIIGLVHHLQIASYQSKSIIKVVLYALLILGLMISFGFYSSYEIASGTNAFRMNMLPFLVASVFLIGYEMSLIIQNYNLHGLLLTSISRILIVISGVVMHFILAPSYATYLIILVLIIMVIYYVIDDEMRDTL